MIQKINDTVLGPVNTLIDQIAKRSNIFRARDKADLRRREQMVLYHCSRPTLDECVEIAQRCR